MNETIARLVDAQNRHDPEGMAACFASDYRSGHPLHPNREFGGSQQVAANWTQMFAGVPDFSCAVIDSTTDGRTTWTEYEWRGHHQDGALLLMRGVVLMGLDDEGLVAWGRFYIEEVEQDGAAIDEAVQHLSGARR